MGNFLFCKTNKKTLLLGIAGLMAGGFHATATHAQESDNIPSEHEIKTLEAIHVYGEQGETDTATHLELSIFATPQTVTAVSEAQMEDFALDNVNDVLDYTPGVTVEEFETNRTVYTARGFDIVNFQYDGLGVPFVYGQAYGKRDTAIYEKVEVIKGAAGLITGLANPSATINFVRKRPTEDLQIGTKLSVNDWSGVRVDADVSGAISDKVRGRLVVAKEDSKSYLDRYEEENSVVYGVLEVDVTDQTLLTVGHVYDQNNANGVLWGALPLVYDDGTQTDYDVATSNAPDWTFGNSIEQQTFLDIKHELGSGWNFNGVFTHNIVDYDSELFFVWGTPVRADETGLNGWASAFESQEEQQIYDIFASGDFELADREHQLVIGYNHSKSTMDAKSIYDSTNGFPVLGSDWAEGNTPRPNFVDHDPATDTANIELTQKSFYVSSRLNPTDELSILLGARNVDLTQKGTNYGASSDTDAKRTVPFYGVTYQLTDELMAYGSYSEVFRQQAWVNSTFEPLGATNGENTEIGLKKSFNNERAILTVALFQAELGNFGKFVSRDATTGTALYEPREFESKGFEVEFSGEVMTGLNVGAGFTLVDVKDKELGEAVQYIPSQLVKLSASYKVPTVSALKVSGAFKWQDDIKTTSKTAEQKAYSRLDLAVQYGVNANVTVALNVNNVTNEKYLGSLYKEQSFYAAPRNVQASVSWNY
ncbi:MAG: TonB-dependent siderophore receptor [Thiotrichaceae bacterium]|nr:TonB-dependent siderophore receptor [Thiotrichaceae bacterium]